ncbi:hypothetical protein C1S81_05350 [Mycolicibacterium neoaurum]|nr:hypothetical protein C1S81_05350 [Mycolicibacterium neoaurum]
MTPIVLYRLCRGLADRFGGHPRPMNAQPDKSDTDASTDTDEVPPPGPTDQGRTGGMATREVAPDVVEKHRGESLD